MTDDLQSLSDVDGAFSNISATSSDTGVLTASAAPNTAIGTHTVTVNNLATTSSWYSDEESNSSAALPDGSFSITEGGTTTNFSTGTATGASNSLDSLAAAINAAGIGVNASVVNDANGSRLAVVARTSGSAANIAISSASGLQFTSNVSGTDASLDVDGVPVTSASNTVTGVINGLTLNLQSKSSSPVTVSLSPDTSTIQSAVSSFVSDYNTLIKSLNGQFTYSSSTSSEGVLSADSTTRALQSDVLNAANLTIGTGTLTNLSSLGITTNQDGTLSLNTQTLDAAVSGNYQGVVNFFQGGGSTSGFASTFLSTLNSYTDPAQGAFTVDLQSISNENQDLQNQINDYEVYIASQQTLLTTEYNNANIALQQLPETIKQTQTLLGENQSSSNS